MIQAEFTLCILDDEFIENSSAYQSIKEFLGEELAAAFTYQYLVDVGGECAQIAEIITGGVKPGGMI